MKQDQIETILSVSRPVGFSGAGDSYLPPLIVSLKQMLYRLKKKIDLPACCFDSYHLEMLAMVLVEFSEDIHNDIGIWRSLEYYNEKFFGIRLPLTTEPNEAVTPEGFDPLRIRHLLWKTLHELEPALIISPKHLGVRLMAEKTSLFLTKRFQEIPQDSGIKKFLSGPNRHGWEIKNKLIWLGVNSYLLRLCIDNYVANLVPDAQLDDPPIAVEDDFIYQECTQWSGLGAVELLAQALDLTDADRQTLLSWRERHTAVYRVLSRSCKAGEPRTITVLNLINDKTYTTLTEMADCPFQRDQIVSGNLVPWRNYWCWTGVQEIWGRHDEQMIKRIRRDFLERRTAISYRYCPELAKKARETARSYHEHFISYHGSDLVVHPDGRATAAAMEQMMLAQYQKVSANELAQIMKDHGFSQPTPYTQFPPELLQNCHGLGTFSTPDEGPETMIEFNVLTAGMAKKGIGLTEDEVYAIRGFIDSPAISVAFVRRLAKEYGAASIGAAYFIREFNDTGDLEYMLRCHKGHFYQKRYPAFGFAQLEQ